jgi:signal transduction histidine kinase
VRASISSGEREREAIAREIGALEQSPRGRDLWQDVLAASSLRARERRALMDAVDGGDPGQVTRAYARWNLATGQTSALVADLSVFNLRRLEHAVDDVEEVRWRAVELLVMVLAVSAALILGFSLLLDRTLVRPLAAMTAAARRIANERTALPVPGGERTDELGVLARAMTGTAADLVDANAELARSVASRDEFLSIASHELKTPLTALKLQLQSGARRWRARGDDPLPPWLHSALRQLDRVEALVAELLDLVRIRSGRLTLRPEETDVAELARGVGERLREVLAKSGNLLEIAVDEPMAAVSDAARVEQVLENLLVNAALHAPGSRVLLRACRDGGRAVLTVEDDGPGIPPEARERVFRPYEKVHLGRTGPGLGLGLYIARQIVEAHGGRIDAGVARSGGAAFRVELPSAP